MRTPNARGPILSILPSLLLAWSLTGPAEAEPASDPWSTAEVFGEDSSEDDSQTAPALHENEPEIVPPPGEPPAAPSADQRAGPAPALRDPDETAETSEDREPEPDGEVWEGVEAILVESQRRMIDLQDASESITSFSADELDGQGLVNFQDLQYNVPNLFTGGGISRTTLRGVGSEIVGPGTDPGFAVHVNGVYTARSNTGNIDYFDIERVDVLRGPQGTLWGRNSTGGAINIVTARPKYELGAKADLDYESFKEGATGYRIRSVLNLPIVDQKFAARFAFLAYFNDGLTLNRGPTGNQRVNDAETYSLRASLRWQPNDRLTVDFVGSVLSADAAGQAPKFAGPFESRTGFASAGTGPGVDYTGALPNPSNPFRGTADTRSDTDTTLYTATILIDWEGDAYQIQSITGYQSTDFETSRDLDASSLPIATLDLADKSRQVSQELLLHSSWDLPFDYTIGAIYQYDWTPYTRLDVANIQNTSEATDYQLFSSFLFQTFVDGCMPFTFGTGCPPTKPRGVPREDFIRAFARVDNHVLGLYANLSWEITERMRLSAGGRYSYTHRKWDDKTVAQAFAATSSVAGLQVLQLGQQQDGSWESGTWKVTADYRVVPNVLLWASVGTGARAGGFNFVDEQSFGQEEILAVEAGFKGGFFERRMTLNVTGFWYDWDDPQIRGTNDNVPFTTNAPSAESYGIEVESRMSVTDELMLDATFGWLEATYDRSFFDLERTIPDYTASITNRYQTVDIEGNRLPRSPRFSVSAGAEYTHTLADGATFTPRVDFYYRAETSFRQFDNPLDEQEAYTRTDVRLTWRSPEAHFSVELFMRNLENNEVKTNQELYENIYRLYYYDAPRSGGIRIGYEY